MQKLAQPDRLRERIRQWTASETWAGRLLDRAVTVVEALLYRGDLRGLLGVPYRQARRVVANPATRLPRGAGA